MFKDIFFFDSYAIIEVILGNKDYSTYADSVILATKLNLFEVFYGLLKDVGEEEANSFLEKYYEFTIDFDENIIKEAAKFKLKNKTRNLSMTDCIGYCLAKKWGVKFLTGDKEFKDMENVEYVK